MKQDIVVDGKSEYVIAVATNPISSETTAANELQRYIAKSTGVILSIINECDIERNAPAIFVGQTSFTRELDDIVYGEEQWAIKTEQNRLVLTGGRPRGTLYAVYHFLEDYMGIHWWTIWDETVPFHNSLSICDLNVSGEPAFIYRDIYDAELPWPKEFYARNRVNGHFSFIPWEYGGTLQYGPPHHVHTFSHYFPPEKYFNIHPEYYSLSNGERIYNGQLCLTNSNVFDEWIAKLKEYIKTSYKEADSKGIPRPVYFSVSQNDWEGSCECESCKAIYEKEGHSGLSLIFVNAIAEEIEKEYPEILIDTLAYWFYEEPPKSIKPRHNVRLRLCDMGEDIMHSIIHENNKNGMRRLKEWSKITDHLNIWKYGVIYSPNLPIPSQLDYADDVKTYREYGVEGIFIELENIMTTDMWEMKAWMLAKLYENPYADSNMLVKEFTDGYYGPAGNDIRRYLDVVHNQLQLKSDYINFGGTPNKYNYLTADIVRKCDAIFDHAESTVNNNQVYLDRVQLARTSLDRTICFRTRELQNNYEGEFDPVIKKSAKRAAAILRKMADARFAEYEKYAKDAYDQATLLEMMSELPVKTSLPDEFASLPQDHVFDFCPKDFRLAGPAFVKDSEAAYGSAAKLDYVLAGNDAVKYKVTNTEGMPMGLFNVNDRVFGDTVYITLDQIRPGYNFYKLGPCRYKHSEYFNMFWDWTLQLDLTSTLNSNPDQQYEIYASVKYEGPMFGLGDSAKTNAIYVDRIIVVRI